MTVHFLVMRNIFSPPLLCPPKKGRGGLKESNLGHISNSTTETLTFHQSLPGEVLPACINTCLHKSEDHPILTKAMNNSRSNPQLGEHKRFLFSTSFPIAQGI